MDVITKDWSSSKYLKLWLNVSICVPTFLVVETLAAFKWPFMTILTVVLAGSAVMGVLCGLMGVLGRRTQKNFVTLISDVFGKKFSKFFYVLRGLDCAGWYGINIAAATQLIVNLITVVTGVKVSNPIFIGIFLVLLVGNAVIAQSSGGLQRLLTITLCVLIPGIVIILFQMGGRVFANANFFVNSQGLVFRDVIGNICVVAAYWNGFALNMFDFGRNAKSDKSAFWGNCVGIVLGMGAMTVIAAIFAIQSFMTTGSYNWNLSHSLLHVSSSVPIHILVVVVFLMFMISTNSVANYYPAIQCLKAIMTKSRNSINMAIFLVISSAITPFFLSSSTSQLAYYWINLCGTVLAPLLAVLICYIILAKYHTVNADQYKWIYIVWTSAYIGIELVTLSILSYLWIIAIIGIFSTVTILHRLGQHAQKTNLVDGDL